MEEVRSNTQLQAANRILFHHEEGLKCFLVIQSRKVAFLKKVISYNLHNPLKFSRTLNLTVNAELKLFIFCNFKWI